MPIGSVVSYMDASEFYTFLWSIKDESKRSVKEQLIQEFIDNANSSDMEAGIELLAGQRFSNNGVSTKTAISALSRAFSVSEEEITELYTEVGALTETVEKLLSKDGMEQGTDSLEGVFEKIESISELSGNAQISRLANVIATSHQQLVIFGVLGDDLSTSVTRKTIANAVAGEYSATEIEKARALVSDSVEFVKYVNSGQEFPPSVEVGNPFEPMKASSKELPEDVSNWKAQLKVDGYRILLHISDNKATAYTRKLDDVSYSIPELQEIEWPDGEYIFDCEAISYEDGVRLGYSATSERIGRKHNINGFSTEIHFEAFDCIYANRDISQEPFEKRFSRLQLYFPNHTYTTVLELYSDISDANTYASEQNYEGIIVKDMSEPYRFDKRSTSWRKVKRTGETVDLVVVDFDSGSGEDAGTLGRMRLETADGEFVGYVGNGWTDEQQEEIWKNQESYKDSIAEISFEGFDEKLRFPVFENWRPDGEADTLERVKQIGTAY